MILSSELFRLEAYLNAATDDPQWVGSNRRGGGLACDAAVSNVERRAVQGANEAIRPQATALQLRHCVRAFVLDSEEFGLGVADQNVVAGHLEGLAAAIGYLCDINQISKRAVIQSDISTHRIRAGIVALAEGGGRFFAPANAVILTALDRPKTKR